MDERAPLADAIADRIRGNQIHAMESNMLNSLAGYLAAVVLAGYVARADWGPLLAIWGPLVLTVCALRIVIALRTTRAGARPMGVGIERALVATSGFVSMTMMFGPSWMALNSEGALSALMIMLVVSTLGGGSVILAPLFSCAVSFGLVNIPIWAGMLALSGVTEAKLAIVVMLLVSAVLSLDTVKRYARSFEAGQRQQIGLENQSRQLRRQTEDLRQQADVIGLLLKDHEDQSSDWLWQIDAAGTLIKPSSRFIEAFASRRRALEGTSLFDLFSAGNVAGNRDALAVLRAHLAADRSFRDVVIPGALAGQPRWWTVSGKPILDLNERVIGYRGVMGDVTAAKEAQAHVDYLAHHDALTGLSNRARFAGQVQAWLANDPGHDRSVSLISIDLDGFKPVNDRFGHPVGDALLAAIGRRLIAITAGREAIVARLGGDEFALAVHDLDGAGLDGLCSELIQAISTPQRIGLHDIFVGTSLGVAVSPVDGTTVDELLKNADAALYRAKREGRGQYRCFDARIDSQVEVRLAMLQDLREALPAGQLSLHYQPFIDSQTGEVTGCEALLRWHHPTRGLVGPNEFIPIAEESGLITEIGKWVIARACATAVRWPDPIRVSVNVSPRQFRDTTLPAYIEATLRESGLPPHRLEVEVTEAVLIDDATQAMEILRRIRAIGVKLSLDDFGTGYSSLSYLRDFPFDKVKIDRSFVRNIEERHDSQVIVEGIRSIAFGLGMTITAEGVETPAQALRLRTSGCHELQGFLFSKARPEAEIPPLLEMRHPVDGAQAPAEGRKPERYAIS